MAWLFVLVVCVSVLSIVLNVLKAILIVAAIGLAMGVVMGLRRFRRRPAAPLPAGERTSLPRGGK